MTSLIKNRWFCAALLLSSLQLASAQPSSNLDYFSFGPPLTPVWDLSGTYQITNFMQGSKIKPMTIVFNALPIAVDSHGKLQGGGTILVPVGDDVVGGDAKVNGNMSGGGAKIKAKFSVHFKGNGVVAGVLTTCKINATYKLDISPLSTNMIGTTTGNANFSKLGSGSLKGPIVLPLPPGADGGWNVTLDVIPFNRKLSGTAVIQVDGSPPAILSTKANGNLRNDSGSAKVKLSGTGNSGGTQLNMQFIPVFGATNLAASINGKVLGQKVKN